MEIMPLLPVVSLLLLSGFAAASVAAPEWRVSRSDFARGVASPNIREKAPLLQEMGGVLYLRVDNRSDTSLRITDLLIGDAPIDTLLRERKAWWWRQRPETIPPDGMGVVEVCVTSHVLPADGGPIRVSLVDANGSRQEYRHPMHTERGLAISYAYREADRLVVYVRNDHPWMTYRPETLAVNGQSLDAVFVPDVLHPGAVSRTEVRPFSAVPVRELALWELTARDMTDKPVLTMRSRTLVDPRFPIGVWQSSDSWTDEPHRRELQQAGIDCLFTSVMGLATDPQYSRDVLRRYRMTPISIPEPWQGDELNVTFHETVQAYFDNYRNDPPVIGWDACEEPDWEKPDYTYPATAQVAARVTAIRRAAGYHPITGTLCRSRLFYAFAPILDVPIMDAYRVGAPSADTPPFYWGNFLESVVDYTRDLKRNGEPSPSWVWAQGVHDWWERAWANGKPGRPSPSPEETRAQLYMQLGEGAKGVLWFRYIKPEVMEQAYLRNLEKNQRMLQRMGLNLTADDVRAIFPQWRAWWAETWQAMQDMNTEMRILRPVISRAEQVRSPRVLTAPKPHRLYTGSVASDRALIAYIVNLDYEFDPTGYVFTPQRNVRLAIELPVWADGWTSAWLLQGGTWTPLAMQTLNATTRQVTLRSLKDGAIVVVGPAGLPAVMPPSERSIEP